MIGGIGLKKRYFFAAALILAAVVAVCAVILLPDIDAPPSDAAPPSRYNTVPIIYITTEDMTAIPDDKQYVPCSVTLENGGESYFVTDLPASVRVRGNGSLTVGKKHGKMPYKLKFDKKLNLFGAGSGEAKDWVLLANMSDYTMLRNFAAKRLGERLSGIPYSPASVPVSLYVNNEYAGVYELTEQVETGKHRVPVDDTLSGAENGFLVELDHYAQNADPKDVTFRLGENHYTVKSRVANDAQLDHIISCISEVEKAIYSGDRNRISSLVDMDSLIDTYLLQEFAKNTDAGFSSFYMYMETGGKLVFAPPWDFDLAFGNDRRLDDGSPEGIYVGTGRKGFVQNHLWYISLYKRPWFKAEVSKRWREISDTEILSLISEVEAMAEVLSPDMETNFSRWIREEGEFYQLEPDHIVALSSYGEYVGQLTDWMRARKNFLDREFSK